MPPASSQTLSLLATALDRQANDGSLPTESTLKDLLALVVRQGTVLQARILLTSSPMAKYLSLLPEAHWLNECWPGESWPLTTPDCAPPEGMPHFSVVTPSFNQGIFLKDTIASVMRQGFASYEHIVMDGGSTDGTLELLRAHPHIQWKSEPDRGQTHALNKALSMARGEIIAWINSDDFYLPGTFQAVHDFFAAHPAENVVTGDSLWGWERTGRLRYIPGEERDFESLIRQWNSHVPGPQPAIFFRRRVLEAVGHGDESLHYGMDYDLWLRMALAGYVRRHMDTPVAFYRFHGHSKSGAQQDWTAFYDDWQTCFTRYRGHSHILPKERMLAVAYPLRASADARERATLCAALKLCAQWKLRDMELALITDVPGAQREDLPPNAAAEHVHNALPGLPPLSLPLRVVPVSTMDAETFVTTAIKETSAFALCMPPVSSTIPYEQWYVTPLNMLVDDRSLLCAPLMLRRGKVPAHPFLPFDGVLNSLSMYQRNVLAEALD